MRRRTLLSLPPAMALAACARIPTSGPVVPMAPASSHSAEQGIGIAPQPPVAGASPDMILAGFLLAMTSDRPGYPVARQYLTQSASNDWKPESGAVIYESENHKPVTTEDSAALNAPWVGSLDGQGRHTPQVGTFKHNFRMIKVGGEWRIGGPPAGLLLARYLFQRYFRPVTLYFLAASGDTVAPEIVHLQEAMVNSTTALQGLLAGPAPWLRPAVGTAIPADTRSTVASVSVENGLAEVSLTEQVSGLADRQREQVAAQLMWTMNQFPQVTSVRITMNGQPWALPGDASGLVSLGDVAGFAPLDSRTWANAFAARDAVVGQLDQRLAGQFRPVAGGFGTADWGDTVGAIAVSRDEQTLAVVSQDRRRLWVGDAERGTPRLVHEGANLLRPQITADGAVWTVSARGSGVEAVVHLRYGGTTQAASIVDLPPGTVTAFRISPDLTKMALVLVQEGRQVLGLVRLRDRDKQLSLDGWVELPLHASHGLLTMLRDVVWAESLELLVVGASQADPHHSVYRVRVDGSQVEGLGPSETDVEISQISALPRISGTTALLLGQDQIVWRFEDRFRWQAVESGYPVVTLPG